MDFDDSIMMTVLLFQKRTGNTAEIPEFFRNYLMTSFRIPMHHSSICQNAGGKIG
jgi:hypothetical protein